MGRTGPVQFLIDFAPEGRQVGPQELPAGKDLEPWAATDHFHPAARTSRPSETVLIMNEEPGPVTAPGQQTSPMEVVEVVIDKRWISYLTRAMLYVGVEIYGPCPLPYAEENDSGGDRLDTYFTRPAGLVLNEEITSP